ncbi:MAG TPA: hypothetical protein VJQ09_05975 [Candidatus Limnocylindria bacterium]|nr:hypothetical protein [Candidatus Limnocylindria bacterium]
MGGRATGSRVSAGRFAAANGLALLLVLIGVSQPWVAATGDAPAGIAQQYLPFALALAAIGSALVGGHLPRSRHGAFLARHFAIYAAVPLFLFVQSRDVDPNKSVLGAIYLLAVLLWTLHALEGLWHAVAGLRDRTAAWLLAAILLVPFLALLPYERDYIPTASDEPHYLVIVQSLLSGHGLDLKTTYDAQAYRAYYPDVLPDRHIIQSGDAQYPIRDLGVPLLALIPFAIAGRTGVLVLICLIGSALSAQLYLACRDLRIAHRPALLAVAGASLAHPILTYTTQIYPELIAALAFVTAARLLRDGRATSLTALAASSACLGTLPWLSTRAWLIAVGAGVVLAYCALRPAAHLTRSALAARAAAAAAPFAALVLLLAAVDDAMFGIFLPSAGYFLIRDQQQVLAFAPHVGALGLLFDRVFGLVPRAPLYLLCALGAVPLWRHTRNASLACLALGWLVYFVFIADIAYWWADGSPPSRYLLAGIPFLVVLLAAGIERLASLGRARAVAGPLAWGLAAYSLSVAYVFAVDPSIRYDLALDIRASGYEGQLFEFLGRVIRPDPAILFPSLVQATAADLALGAAWLALVAVVAFASRARVRPS